MTAKQVPYTMGKQVSFDYFCTIAHGFLVAVCSAEVLERVDGLTPVLAALPAAVLACVLSHPGRRRPHAVLQGGPATGRRRRGVAEDPQGRSALPGPEGRRLLHVIGIIWVQLVIYDYVKRAVGAAGDAGH